MVFFETINFFLKANFDLPFYLKLVILERILHEG